MTAPHTIAHYRITSRLGEGGMGEVWRATDTRLGREVAIKLLPHAFAVDAERIARFQREAKVLASLSHPNIAAIYGIEEGALVMELVDGPTLAERIAQGPIPLDEALLIARQIADALDAAHEKGIVHRDLKPANVKLAPDGCVKVLDFGLAKVVSGDLIPADPAKSPTITMAGTVAGVILGTAGYMAPEQAKGKTVDKRVDIWAFGVVFYEMLAGRPPFKGESVGDILASVLKDEPDLSSLPSPARRLVGRCLEKDPKQRLRDIGDYVELLESAPPIVAPASARLPWVIAAAALLAVLSLTGWIWFRPVPLPEVTRFEIHAPAGSTLPLGTPAPSPDGRMLAYTVKGPDSISRIHVRALDSTQSRVLPGTENATHPFWSPDGRSLAFTADGNLERIDLAGGLPRVLAATGSPWHGDWGRTGVILYHSAPSVTQMPAEGGPGATVVKLDEKKGESNSSYPFFLPDGERFLVNVRRADGSGGIELAVLGSMERRPVLNGVISAPLAATASDGKAYLLYLRDDSLMAQQFDETAGAVRESPFVLVEGVGRVGMPPVRPAVGVSSGGVLAWQTAPDSESGGLVWVNRSGGRLTQLPSVDGESAPSLSPDGRYIAANKLSRTGWDIWLTDVTRRSSTRFTFGDAGKSYASPVWSPDGKRIAYTVVGGGLFVKDADGTGGEHELAKYAVPLSWSRDGQRILAFREGRLFLMPLDGSPPIPVGASTGSPLGADISPDGKYVAFSSAESGRLEVYVEGIPPMRGKWQISVNGGVQPLWRRDGKELFFLSPDSKMMAVDVHAGSAVSSGIPRILFEASPSASSRPRSYDVTADGQRFLIASGASGTENAPITVVLNWWAGLKDN